MELIDIIVKDLNIYYDDKLVIKNLSLTIPKKKITTIIGPSGCGKSTFLKAINRLHDINPKVKVSGSVLVDNEDIYANNNNINLIRKKIGLLSQRPTPLPMSILENVVFGAKIHKLKGNDILAQLEKAQEHFTFDGFKEKIKDCQKGAEKNLMAEFYLRLSGLWDEVKDRLSAPATQLSVGQQQRLCLARGLAVEPEIILCDEPTSALDPHSAQRIEERLLALKEFYTIVVVTHTRAQAKRLADYVIFIYLGELIECGEPEQLFQNPIDSRTKLYIEGKFIKISDNIPQSKL